MQPDTVTQFQEDIFGGRWDAALQLLPKLTFDSDVALQASMHQAYLYLHSPALYVSLPVPLLLGHKGRAVCNWVLSDARATRHIKTLTR